MPAASEPIHARIGHVHLKVRDLARAEVFYSGLLGLKVAERVGAHFAFLSSSGVHHEVALQALGPNAPGPHPYGVGLYHTAFEVEDKAALARAYFTLTAAGIDVHPVDHRISWAIYCDDPDGNGVELYTDTRHLPGGTSTWGGASLPLTEAQMRAAIESEAPVVAAAV